MAKTFQVLPDLGSQIPQLWVGYGRKLQKGGCARTQRVRKETLVNTGKLYLLLNPLLMERSKVLNVKGEGWLKVIAVNSWIGTPAPLLGKLGLVLVSTRVPGQVTGKELQ